MASPSFKKKYDSPPPPSQEQQQEQPPTSSLKERRRSHLKPLRIAPTAPTSPPPLSSLPYPTPTTSSSSSTTSAASSTSEPPTFNQKITYSNQLPQKQKRRRRSPEEFAELMSIFEKTPKPCRQLREHLSRRLNMSVREVQIWFQNQRAKISRQARLTPSTPSGPPISSPTRRNTCPIGDDGYPRIPMTAIGLTQAHPYAASPYRQATYPAFLDHNTNAHNHPEDHDPLKYSKPMLYPASPVSVNDPRPYYGEGATLPAITGSNHQRSQSQPLFSYSNYNMDDAHHHPRRLPSYPDPHAQRYAMTTGDRFGSSVPVNPISSSPAQRYAMTTGDRFGSSVPVNPISSSPCSIPSSEEGRKVTDEEVQTFADAMALLAEVATQDQTHQKPLNVEKKDSCNDDRQEVEKTTVVEQIRSAEAGSSETDSKESRESDEAMMADDKDQVEMADKEGQELSVADTEDRTTVEDGVVNAQEPVPVTNKE